AVRPGRVQVGLEHPADQEPGQGRAVEVVEELAQRRDEVGPEQLRRAQPVQDERPALGQPEGLAQELPEVTRTPRSRSSSVNASCSSLAFLPHMTSSKSSSPTFRGVSRDSSRPGRCTMTWRSLPASEATLKVISGLRPI